MRQPISPGQNAPYPWQNPDFLKDFDRSLLPTSARSSTPKRKKEEKERLFKQITRRVAR